MAQSHPVTTIVVASIAVLGFLACTRQASADPPADGTFIATAYSQQGTTASGQYTHRHVVAADPAILPIGSRIKIRRAGRYSGEYVVADTGLKVEGRKLDIYLPSPRACKKFGNRPVKVRVIQLGDGTHQAAKEADQAVKADVAKDVKNKVVGNAATEADWKGKSASADDSKSTSAPQANTTPPPK
ncbi:MAG: 3D domain-containing protein [Bryobacteraceae bacterium]